MTRLSRISLTLIGLLLLNSLTGLASQPQQQNLPANIENITAAELKDYLNFIASDELEGRDTPSRGLDTAAKFIALNLARWGLKPAGDQGSYFQHIGLRRETVDVTKTAAEIDGHSYQFGKDFLTGQLAGSASAPLVFVGYGWFVKSKNINPYANIDVKDKIVVYLASTTGLPKGVTYGDLTGKAGEDWQDPFSYARQHGAKGTIIIPDFHILSLWEQIRQSREEHGQVTVERLPRLEQNIIPSIIPSIDMVKALFQGEKRDATTVFNRETSASEEPFEFSANKKVSFTVTNHYETVGTQNVVAVLEGSDPTLKNEYVAIGAHYDHVGIGQPINGDKIYNGADDDGSGTTAVLALAEAFAHGQHPKRSILFVWHAGEEKGLWGSDYFTRYPLIPLNQIVTQLNIDMIGRSKKEGDQNPANRELSGPNEIYVIGSKLMSTELGELSESVNRNYLNLNFNYLYDDPNDPNHFFSRSDHYNYAQKGIPIIFYFDGVHEDYHRPSDSPDKIDYQKMEKVTRTIFATAWALANQPQRPKVDKQLPPEFRGGH